MRVRLCALLSIVSLAIPAAADFQEPGEALLAEGRYQEAREHFQRALAENPRSARAHYMLGKTQFLVGDLDGALEEAEKAIELEEHSVEIRLFLATLYGQKTRRARFLSAPMWAGRWLRELEASHRLEPDNVEARSRLIEYYLHAPAIGGGDKKQATKLASETIALDEIKGRLLLAHAHRDSDRFGEARVEYEKILQRDPANVAAHIGMGRTLDASGDSTAAEEWFVKAIKIAPGDPAAHESLGDHFAARGITSRAVRSYLEALSLEPKAAAARYALASLYEDLGRPVEARQQYEAILRETPHFIDVEEARKRLARLGD